MSDEYNQLIDLMARLRLVVSPTDGEPVKFDIVVDDDVWLKLAERVVHSSGFENVFEYKGENAGHGAFCIMGVKFRARSTVK